MLIMSILMEIYYCLDLIFEDYAGGFGRNIQIIVSEICPFIISPI
jgi:hypothetical protein